MKLHSYLVLKFISKISKIHYHAFYKSLLYTLSYRAWNGSHLCPGLFFEFRYCPRHASIYIIYTLVRTIQSQSSD